MIALWDLRPSAPAHRSLGTIGTVASDHLSRTMRYAIALFIAACALSARTARSQAILEVPGKRIEVVGLRRWTIPMMQDSLRKYASGVTLDSRACAAALRYKLGFADASASYYGVLPNDSVQSIVLSVIEPQDSALVRFRPTPMDTTRPRSEWAPVVSLVGSKQGALLFAIHETVSRQAGQPAPEVPARVDTVALATMRRFLAAHQRPRDLRTALTVLRTDPNFRNRTVAAALLVNFLDDDRALNALVDALRESDGPVKAVAAQLLYDFAEQKPRVIDWQAATPSIHAILNGTSVVVDRQLMDLFVATGAGPKHASAFLEDGGDRLLLYLDARHPWPRQSATALLKALSGVDRGPDAAAWRAWIATLR